VHTLSPHAGAFGRATQLVGWQQAPGTQSASVVHASVLTTIVGSLVEAGGASSAPEDVVVVVVVVSVVVGWVVARSPLPQPGKQPIETRASESEMTRS